MVYIKKKSKNRRAKLEKRKYGWDNWANPCQTQPSLQQWDAPTKRTFYIRWGSSEDDDENLENM